MARLARRWVLALAGIGLLAPAARAEDCPPQDRLVDVLVLYFGPGFWDAAVCADGAFRASDGDGKYTKQLTAEELSRLRELLAALPTEKSTYSFGVGPVDAPEMALTARVGGVARRYGVGANVKGERGNAAFLPVARLAIFVRGQFKSDRAVSVEKWFADSMEASRD